MEHKMDFAMAGRLEIYTVAWSDEWKEFGMAGRMEIFGVAWKVAQ